MNSKDETKFCKFCGERIAFNAVICPKCGRQIEEIEISYKNAKPKKRKKLGIFHFLICVFGFYLMLAAVIGSLIATRHPSQPQMNALLTQTMNLTQAQTQQMSEILKACDIGEITYCNKEKENKTETKYSLADKELDYYTLYGYVFETTIDNSTKTIKTISFNDHKIYADGKVISKATAHYINDELRTAYKHIIKDYITQLLNYPKSAKFKSVDYWSFVVEPNGYDSINSQVEAKNAFGMEKQLNFKILIDRGQAKIMYVSLGGTVYVNKIK